MPTRKLLAIAAVLVLAATGCGSSGSSKAAGAKGCKPASGTDLIVLTDDKKLQTVDNVIPAINSKKADATLVGALDKVSAVLTTAKLLKLNQQTDLERKTSKVAAEGFVKAESLDQGLSGGKGTIKIGAANFSENQTLGNIYADVLTAAGYQASVQTIGNRELYLPALEKGEIDIVPEYAGTLTEFLNKKQNGPNATAKASTDLTATVQALTTLGDKAGLKFGKPAEAADQNAFAVRKAFADKNGLKTLSDVAAKCNGGKLVLGGPTECKKRPFCEPGLQSKYGIKFTGFKALDTAGPLTKTALKTGKIDIGLVLSSDAGLSAG
ncbi:MAG: glycine/betaine ABC transporter substrate-binding protein [Actinomycetota bacterium]|nr:glycine/betaine ABC transporter substrate-binding protein [Actinomycetota bacterium]